MKKEYILGVLFFGGLWGISEALLGGALYRSGVPYASVPLTIIGFIILTFARAYFPQLGTATLIAVCAMMYKFLNTPFFACHFLGIVLLGASYDLFFSVLNIKNSSVKAAAATYLGYVSFAVMITYLFRYPYWVDRGFAGVMQHILIGGTITALGCAIMVPLSERWSQSLRSVQDTPFGWGRQLVPAGTSLVTTGLWAFGVMMLASHLL